jgi:hypothetical protein
MYKTINLKEVQIYLINLEEDHERRNAIYEWCSRLGFLNPIIVPGIRSTPHSIGLSEAHRNAIELGIESRKPFIVMEDDAFPNYEDESYIITIPEDAEAVYLGASRYGVDYDNPHTHKDPGALFHQVNPDELIFRVFNTLTTHAILYIDKEYSLSAMDVALKSFTTDVRPVDLAFASYLLQNHKVYFLKPFFYQNDPKKIEQSESTKNVNPRDHLK